MLAQNKECRQRLAQSRNDMAREVSVKHQKNMAAGVGESERSYNGDLQKTAKQKRPKRSLLLKGVLGLEIIEVIRGITTF